MEELVQEINKLKQDIAALQQKRIYQADIIPQAVKSRHMGEGNPYIFAGLESDLPTMGNSVPQGVSVYFCVDTFKLKIWTGTVWKSSTFS